MTVDIRIGDCRETLRAMPDRSVQCCVTSPPYFGLRDYGNDGQIGLEQTPEAFVAEIVAVFAEVRRVLRDDGTLWLNLGDSYARAGGTDRKVPNTAKVGSTRNTLTQMSERKQKTPDGLKEKDLIGIPWRVAFALQADGWYLRQDIIWHKPNPMPESVTDRCTKAHEYIFLLSKGPRYYFDHEAIRERAVTGGAEITGTSTTRDTNRKSEASGSNGRNVQTIGSEAERRDVVGGSFNNNPRLRVTDGLRNKRDVWTVTTKPFKGAHFATFPPDLIEPCILAGSPEGGTVLDPFGGSGTTGMVAKRHRRNAVLLELNPEYAAMAEVRVANEPEPASRGVFD